MNTIRQQILDLKDQWGDKHFSRKIKDTPELYEYVRDCNGDTVSEKIYNFLYPGNDMCHRGNRKKFISINNGYRFCGRAGVCECAKDSVRSSVIISKRSVTPGRQKEINDKRASTSLERYGVTNNGQTPSAKIAHAEFYSLKENVDVAVHKGKRTNAERYGNENYRNGAQISDSWKKYDVDYWAVRLDNENYPLVRDYDYMKSMIELFSVEEIAAHIGVHVQTVYKWLVELNLRDKRDCIPEIQLTAYMTKLGIKNIIRNTRSVLPSGRELDIYLPDYNLAIEHNGVYYHHDGHARINKTYHSDKFFECESLGIQLISIFSPFWQYKRDIVQRLLAHKVGKTCDRVYARNCKIQEIRAADTREFLNTNHIQGYTTASITCGLFYDGILVGVMSFGKSRAGIGIGKSQEGYELIRYSTSISVIGGASKLLKYFIQTYAPVTIWSYSNYPSSSPVF